MVFATCQQQPKAPPVVIENFGFPVWRSEEEHGVEEEKDTENTARIAKCISIRSFLWLFWTTELCGEAGTSQINGLELHK